MKTHAKGTIENKHWEEQSVIEMGGGARVARGRMTELFQGGIAGEGTVEALLAYAADTSATLVGFEYVVGRVGDRSGSFVLQFSGSLDNRTAATTWFVLPGSGTGDLSGLTGHGGYTWDGQTVSYTLDYALD